MLLLLLPFRLITHALLQRSEDNDLYQNVNDASVLILITR